MQEQVILTSHPFDELLRISSEQNIDLKALDFQILGFHTYYTLDGQNYVKASESDLKLFEENEHFLNEKLKIEQKYKIKIHRKAPNSVILSEKIELISNKDLTKLIAKIDLNGLNFYENMPKDVLEIIYKKMIQEGFLLSLRTFDFKQKMLDSFMAYAKNETKKPFFLIQISKGIHRISAEDEKLVQVFRQKIQSQNPTQKIGIIGVKENELVLKHIKPGQSKQGRNLKLAFIKPREAKEQKIEVHCSDNFIIDEKTQEFNSSIITEYKAKKKGFVIEDGTKFDIGNELSFSAISYKEVGAIYAGLDNAVSINVRNTSDIDDAISSGVYIECENLNIEGNIGGNTTLKAKNLTIKGNTQSTSKIYAQEAKIALHRGFLQSKNAELEDLENGVVEAEVVRINKSLGGTIKASQVFISNLTSSTDIDFQKCVVIDQCLGENNKFLVQLGKDNVHFLKLNEILEEQKAIPRQILILKKSIMSSKEGVQTLLSKLKILRAQGRKIPANYAQVIKSYQDACKKVHTLEAKNDELKIQEQKLIEQIKLDEQAFINALVINKSGNWQGMNEIKFIFSFPKTELSYLTKADENAKLFCVKHDFDDSGKLKIQALNDYDEKDIEWSQPSKA